jgi:hypothetical protein
LRGKAPRMYAVYYKTQLLIEAEKLTPILGCLG